MAQFNLNLPEEEADEIILNRHGDKVKVFSDDANFFKKFTEGYAKITKLSDKIKQDMGGIEDVDTENDSTLTTLQKIDEIARVNLDSSKNTCEIIDGIFGEGTARKSFRDKYEENPDFVPDIDLAMAFFATMSPIVEQIFGKKVDRIERFNTQYMDKYQPKDFKKGGSK